MILNETSTGMINSRIDMDTELIEMTVIPAKSGDAVTTLMTRNQAFDLMKTLARLIHDDMIWEAWDKQEREKGA